MILLIYSSLIDYVCGGLAGKHKNTKKGRIFMAVSLVLNLGLLAFFKYGDFFIDTVNSLLNVRIPNTGVSLPIGISFYTMQTISYTIDAYRGKVKVKKSFMKLLLFVFQMFPQLVAGADWCVMKDIEIELADRKTTWQDIYEGSCALSGVWPRRF